MIKVLALESFLPVSFQNKTAPGPVLRKAWAKPQNRFWFYTNILLMALAAFMLLSYLFGVNNNASKGYEIKRLQSKISQLTEENKKSTIKVSEAVSMAAIHNDFLSLNFVSVGQAKFFQVNQYSQR